MKGITVLMPPKSPKLGGLLDILLPQIWGLGGLIEWY